MLRDLLSRMDKLQSEIASAQASPAAGSAAPSVDDAQFAGLLRTLSSDRGGGGVRITRRRVKKARDFDRTSPALAPLSASLTSPGP